MQADQLAVNGGPPVRTEPLPPRRPFGIEDAAEVLDAMEQPALAAAVRELMMERLHGAGGDA